MKFENPRQRPDAQSDKAVPLETHHKSAPQTPEEVRRQVDLLGDEFLESIRRGDAPNRDDLIAAHPDLAPQLGARLKVLEAVLQATQHASGARTTQKSSSFTAFSAETENSIAQSMLNSGAGDPVHELADNPTVSFSEDRVPPPRNARSASCPTCGDPISWGQEQDVTCDSCGSTIHVDNEGARTAKEFSAPESIGRFKVDRLLGQGAFGAVYLASDPKLSRNVAIKVPRRGFFASQSEEHRFFREARSASALQHPNIVKVHEVSDDPDQPFIVSEYVAGTTLADWIKQRPLSFRESVELLVQLAGAVDYAHRNNIIHRDLKPGNVLIDKDRNAFIADFGLARRDDLEVTMTLDGVVMGTPAYMSPEQASGIQGPVNSSTDVYSLGVILYQMLCRKLPFHGNKRMMIHQVIHDEPPQPRRLNDRIPKDLETIALKAMAKTPTARFASAGEFRDELNRWLRGEPIESRPVGNLNRGWRWCRRHRAIASLVTAVGALLITGTIASLIWGSYSGRLRVRAEQNALVADANRKESDSRLYRLNQHSGQFALDRNELIQSAYWYSNALEFEDSPGSRVQLGMIQDRIPKLVNLWPLESSIATLRFSESGERLAAATLEGQVVVFDRTTGETKLDLRTDGLSAVELKITPAGDQIAFNSSSRVVEVWDVDSGERVASLDHDQQVTSIDVDQKGQVVTGCQDSHVRVWDVARQQVHAEIEFGNLPVVRTRMLPESTWVMVELNDDPGNTHQSQIWDYRADQLVGQAIFHRTPFLPWDVSRDRKQLLAAAWGGSIVRVLDIQTGVAIGDEVQLTNRAANVFFTGSGEEFVTVDVNGDVSTWNAKSGARTNSNFRSDGNPLLAITDQDRQIMALPDRKGAIELTWRATGVDVCSSLKNGSRITALEFVGNGRQIALGGIEGVVQVWDLAGSIPQARILEHEQSVQGGLFFRNGKRCLTISTDGNARIWDVATGRQIGKPLEHADGIYACEASRNERWFATGSSDQTAKIWDSETGRQVGVELKHPSPVIQVAFSPEDDCLVTGCLDGTVTSWQINADGTVGKEPRFVVNHNSKINRVVFQDGGKWVATASLDGAVRCWDSRTGEQVGKSMQHGNLAYDCDFLPDGKRLVTCGGNAFVHVWDLARGEIVQSLPCGGYVQSVNATGDGRVLSSGNPGVAHVWQETDGTFALTTMAHNDAVGASCDSQIHPELDLLAVGGGWLRLDQQMGNRGAAYLWDLENNASYCPPLFHFGRVTGLTFSPSGKELMTVATDKTARLWTLSSNDLPVRDARRIAGLYAQLERDAGNRVVWMPGSRQASEFAELSTKYPAYFGCDDVDVRRWEDQRQRIGDIK